jgi:hypothetical protein
MSEDNQILVPVSFVALFIAPGAYKPRETRQHISARYELCEDMAQMLTEHAQRKRFELGVSEDVVLQRIHRGLRVQASGVDEHEAGWVTRRLAELLDWPMPALPDEA